MREAGVVGKIGSVGPCGNGKICLLQLFVERVIENFARSVYPTLVKIRVQDATRISRTLTVVKISVWFVQIRICS